MRTLGLAAVVVVALVAGCQADGFKPPSGYVGVVRSETMEVVLVRPGEAEPGPGAELLGRYQRRGDRFAEKDAAKLARRVGANFVVYSARARDVGKAWVGEAGDDRHGVWSMEPPYESEVLFYRDPGRPGL